MRTIQKLCNVVAEELWITPSHRWVDIENRLQMRDILPQKEWKESGVTCLAARRGMGKSVLAEDILVDAAMWMQKAVVYFPFEQSEESLMRRLIQKISGVDIAEEMEQEEAEIVAAALDFLADLPIVIDNTPGILISELETKLRTLPEIGMVVIGDIQLMCGDNTGHEDRQEELREFVKKLSGISKELQIPVLFTSLVPRTVDYRANKRPHLADMQYGVFAEDVEQMIFLYRERSYRGDSYKEQTDDDSAEIILAKSKSGITKTIRARLDETYFRFCKNEDYDFIVQREYNGTPIRYAVIHGETSRILLIKGGQDSSVYGFQNKYLNVAKRVNAVCGCAVVVSSNPYDRTDSLEDAIRMIKELVCKEPEIYYMGNSNGAVLGGRYAHLHPESKKMLLVNGPLMINWPQTKRGVEQFTGEEVTFVYGDRDPSYKYLGLLGVIERPGKRSVITVEGADHNFKGRDEEFLTLAEKYLLS